jgi:hypothetical protein
MANIRIEKPVFIMGKGVVPLVYNIMITNKQ